jgi:hypothetical protein
LSGVQITRAKRGRDSISKICCWRRPLDALEAILSAGRGKPVTTELRSVGERPLVAFLGWRVPPPTLDSDDIICWTVCVAVAFFELAAERKAAMPPELQHIDQPPKNGHAGGRDKEV